MAVPGIEAVFSSLRVLDLHGERILTSDLALFQSKLPQTCRISITYGTTETGGVFSWFYRADAAGGVTAPVGYVLPGKQVAVLGEEGRPVTKGETGELLVRGETALGSWQKGRLTSARFLQDPDSSSGRIYVTGDLVFQRDDGLFEFVGRKDRQVKIRGLLADLGEIEAALRSADGVDDAVAIVRSSPGHADEIAAFVTPAMPENAPDLPSLRRAVASACAEHMAPSIIRVLPAIPRLANHKPDLLALRAMI
jgi:acyl-coenzyme A synthetase/AMP-(fatty) acid ligase